MSAACASDTAGPVNPSTFRWISRYSGMAPPWMAARWRTDPRQADASVAVGAGIPPGPLSKPEIRHATGKVGSLRVDRGAARSLLAQLWYAAAADRWASSATAICDTDSAGSRQAGYAVTTNGDNDTSLASFGTRSSPRGP